MTSCYICSEIFKLPVSLPCGHVFCSQCIFTTVQTVKPLTPMHRCPTCGSWYNISPLDTKTVPSNLRPFITPSVRPLHLDVLRSDSKTLNRTCNESSAQPSTARSSSVPYPATRPSDDKGSSEMARLRAENNALRNNCSLWRKRAETHGEANLNLLNFARAMRDQASQIARDRNDLEKRCLVLKNQLDGDCSYSDELRPNFCSSVRQDPLTTNNFRMKKYNRPLPVGPEIGEDGLHHSIPSSLLGSRPPSRTNLTRLDSNQSRKRPRISADGNEE